VNDKGRYRQKCFDGNPLGCSRWNFWEIEMPEEFCEEPPFVYRNKLAITSIIVHYLGLATRNDSWRYFVRHGDYTPKRISAAKCAR
jgi:hypothetical protein